MIIKELFDTPTRPVGDATKTDDVTQKVIASFGPEVVSTLNIDELPNGDVLCSFFKDGYLEIHHLPLNLVRYGRMKRGAPMNIAIVTAAYSIANRRALSKGLPVRIVSSPYLYAHYVSLIKKMASRFKLTVDESEVVGYNNDVYPCIIITPKAEVAEMFTFKDHMRAKGLLEELEYQDTPDQELIDTVVKDIKKLIRQGASDLDQKWVNALHLVNKAYQVANATLPTPKQPKAWKQYETLLAYGVDQMFHTRGKQGTFRMTANLTDAS